MERKARDSEFKDDGDSVTDELSMEQEEDDFDDEHDGEEEEEESENEEEDGEEVGEEENGDGQNDNKDAEMEELEKEYMNLHQQEHYYQSTKWSYMGLHMKLILFFKERSS